MNFESKIISREISELLYEQDATLSTAESCTGGRVAEALIAVPGASKYFKGGIICYVNEVKENLLGVSHETLEEKTAFSEEVAREMVEGATKALATTYAIAVTGVAGPGGGTKDIPVGTIWIACGDGNGNVKTELLTEDNGRDINLETATKHALMLFRDFLAEKDIQISSDI